MIDIYKAASIVKNKKLKPIKGITMEKYYVIYAIPEKAKVEDEIDDFMFAVDKKSGEVYEYSPLNEMEKFHAACKKAVDLQ